MKKMLAISFIVICLALTGCPRLLISQVVIRSDNDDIIIEDRDIITVYTDDTELFIETLDPSKIEVEVYYYVEAKTFEPTDIGWLALGIGSGFALIGSEIIGGTHELEWYQSVISLEPGQRAVVIVRADSREFMTFFLHHNGEASEGEGEGEEDVYTLSTEIEGEGTITVSEDGAITSNREFPAGKTVNVNANPAPGWDFNHWEVNNTMGISDPLAQVTMDSNVWLVAVFEQEAPTSYTLSIKVQGNGTVSGAGVYPAGKTVTISATPDNDWKFDHWIVNGTLAYNNPGLITMDSDVNVTAVFMQATQPSYTLSIKVQGQGTTTGAGTYPAGTPVTISATPDSNWTFDHWVVNGNIAYDNPGIINMDSDVSVVAVFTSESDPGGLINFDLSWNGEILSLQVTGASPGVIGLEYYYSQNPWAYRELFNVGSDGTANGILTEFIPNILRFGVVITDDPIYSTGYVPAEAIVVRINGVILERNVPDSDPNNEGLAYQIDLSTL